MGVEDVTQGLTMAPIFCRGIRRPDEFFRVSVRVSSTSVQSPVSPHPWRILDNIFPWYMSLLLLLLVLLMFVMFHLFAVEWSKCHIGSHCDPTVISSHTMCKWSCINSSPDLFWFFINLSAAKQFEYGNGRNWIPRSLAPSQEENRKYFVAKSLIAEVEQLLPQKCFHPKMLSTWHENLIWSWSGLGFLPMVLNRCIFMELFRKSNMCCTYILILMFLLAKEKSQSDSLCFPHILPKWHRTCTSIVTCIYEHSNCWLTLQNKDFQNTFFTGHETISSNLILTFLVWWLYPFLCNYCYWSAME